jgi:hypothetical protein
MGDMCLSADLEGWFNEDFIKYAKTDTITTMQVFDDLQERINAMNRPKIKRVLFNPPATIIFWEDGTKTVVKAQDGDWYDHEKGFVLAYLKKLLGNDNTFNKEINKWVWEE